MSANSRCVLSVKPRLLPSVRDVLREKRRASSLPNRQLRNSQLIADRGDLRIGKKLYGKGVKCQVAAIDTASGASRNAEKGPTLTALSYPI